MNLSNVIISTSNVLNILGSLSGIAVFVVGLINTFWGNDPGFGIFLILLSFVYFPPVNTMIREKSDSRFPLS